MATITTVATAVPAHVIPQADVAALMQRHFVLEPAKLEGMMSLFENAFVQRRYSVVPLEELSEPRSLSESTQIYREHAASLGRKVASDCLEQAGMRAADVDTLITVSCTGIMMPSLDAYLINDLGFRSNVRRLPITELGCAAGACALSRASEFLRAFPRSNALVVSVELPTLTFQRHDASSANLVSSALFGDGAAAALLTSGDAAGPRILDTESYLFPHSLGAMGFDLEDGGLHIVLSKDVPALIRRQVKRLVDTLSERNGFGRDGLSFFVLHPGGKKILGSLEEELGLARAATQPSWDVLRDYGNLSSASVLFVLREWLTGRRPAAGEVGLMAAFGPGVSSEMLLLQWN
jgi:alkylresorcinol/alkylpyrone synthase